MAARWSPSGGSVRFLTDQLGKEPLAANNNSISMGEIKKQRVLSDIWSYLLPFSTPTALATFTKFILYGLTKTDE